MALQLVSSREHVPNKTPEHSLYHVITKTHGMIQANKVFDLLWWGGGNLRIVESHVGLFVVYRVLMRTLVEEPKMVVMEDP
jgi:hypothetical protein